MDKELVNSHGVSMNIRKGMILAAIYGKVPQICGSIAD
jgi:hypothetical protein